MIATERLPQCLLRVWDGQRVVGWYGSEKINGLRCQWDGRRFLTRSGAPFDLPKVFTVACRRTP